MVIFFRVGERLGDDACGERGDVVHTRFGDDSRVGDASTHRNQSEKQTQRIWGRFDSRTGRTKLDKLLTTRPTHAQIDSDETEE